MKKPSLPRFYPGITRRRFLRHSAAGAGILALVPAACSKRPSKPAPDDASAGPTQNQGHEFLTAAEFATVSALCEHILPRDHDPGAIDLGVPDYVDWVLAVDDIPGLRERASKGLAALDSQAHEWFGAGFAQVQPEDRERLMSRWQRSGDHNQRRFLGTMIELTMEGAFGHPMYGGNQDQAGWKLINFKPDECSFHLIAKAGRRRP